MHDIQCFNAQCTMHNAQCTMHNARYTMYNAQCTIDQVYFELYYRSSKKGWAKEMIGKSNNQNTNIILD